LRPLRLELDGFASFREPTIVDFEGADLFVLSGSMGAGKSSIIDAIGFALFGAIARYDKANLIAPLISQGLTQARVRLDFRLGATEYAAVRVVRKGPQGVKTEARLQKGEAVIKDTPKDVTDEVTRLLGLTFQQFTKCVVLPQGEFADLLHATAAERQDLLVRLLDLGMYRNVGVRARQRNARADAVATELQGRLERDLRDATEEAYHAAEARIGRLEALARMLAADDELLKSLRTIATEADARLKIAQDRACSLAVIVLPEGIGDLDARLRQAQHVLEGARAEQEEALACVTKAREKRGALPERAAIDAVIVLYDDQERHRVTAAAAETKVDEAVVAMQSALECLERAEARYAETSAEHDRLLRANAAYHASQGLRAGDICPVCGETLTEAPHAAPPEGIDHVQRAVEERKRALKDATQAAERARTAHELSEQASVNEQSRLERIEASLKGQPSRVDCDATLQAIQATDAATLAADERLTNAGRRLREAQAAVEGLNKDGRAAWSAFNAARDVAIAAGAAPGPRVESLEAAWNDLVTCAGASAAQAQEQATAAQAEAEGARFKENAIVQAQVERCTAEGIATGSRSPRDVVNAALGGAQGDLRQIDAKLAERASVEAELAQCLARKRIAGTLEEHLQKNRFERWYLQEALGRLVRGATQRLWELSREQYSLALNDTGTDFVVIDHINANEQRPVRTLSGGETFLASLALALALGDEIGSLAASGAARLDSLFLDEGFGALDQNTLETVATTLEELGADGRMVGIVTHVQELAERIPVQFRVQKNGATSRIERVDAR
jgi:exonuclease SbcC